TPATPAKDAFNLTSCRSGSVIEVMLCSRSHGISTESCKLITGRGLHMTTSMSIRDTCPECGSERYKKNGHMHNGKQNQQCKDCGRQFVVDATKRVVDEEQRTVVERLLCEKISLHGICRAIGVSIRWLMDFMVACFAAVPEHLHVQPVASSGEVLLGGLEV